jgi:DNA repair exonuclease SbcCD ATPase subunit
MGEQREDYSNQQVTVQKQIENILSRLSANTASLETEQRLIGDADVLRQAVETVDGLRRDLRTKKNLEAEHKVKRAQIEGRRSEASAKISGNNHRQAELTRRIHATRAITASATAVREAVANVKTLKGVVQSWEQAKTEAQLAVDGALLRASSLTTARITDLRDGLTVIAEDRATSPRKHARTVIASDDEKVAKASESTAAGLPEMQELLRIAEASLTTAKGRLTETQITASRLPEIQSAETTLNELLAATEHAESERQGLDTVLAEQNEQEQALAREAEQVTSDIQRLESQIKGHGPMVERAEALKTVDARIKSLEDEKVRLLEDHGTLTTRLGDLEAKVLTLNDQESTRTALIAELTHQTAQIERQTKELDDRLEALQPTVSEAPALAEAKVRKEHLEDELGNAIQRLDDVLDPLGKLSDRITAMEPLPEPIGVTPHEELVRALETSVRTCHGRVATALRDLTDEESRARRLEALSSRVHDLEEVYGNWKLLGLHLGKDHLQKAEINCAGPQLTDRTNELLRTAGDLRHTVSIETERLHSNKKQMVPCLNINVFDSEEGITKESRLLSGYGKMIVGLPFKLALILLGCQRADVIGPTIFLDEATGVMDEVNAPQYIGVIRRFAEILGARILYVAQQRSIQELADSFITIDNGKVTVKANA